VDVIQRPLVESVWVLSDGSLTRTGRINKRTVEFVEAERLEREIAAVLLGDDEVRDSQPFGVVPE